VSGINKGANLGDDITYSGTVSAAMEGTILGIPSIAISVVTQSRFRFDVAAKFAVTVVRKVLDHGLPDDTLLNVNVPNVPQEKISGVRMTRMGKRVYGDVIVEKRDPRGRKYYWIGGDYLSSEEVPGSDLEAIEENYISITPIHLDLTNYSALRALRKWTW
jgi:5'-nucleotidase